MASLGDRCDPSRHVCGVRQGVVAYVRRKPAKGNRFVFRTPRENRILNPTKSVCPWNHALTKVHACKALLAVHSERTRDHTLTSEA